MTRGATRWGSIALAFTCTILFLALGIWQVERRAWKLDLIARVDARVHAPAGPLPARSEWARINASDNGYAHVQASGTWLHDRETLVQAVTDLGAGFWVMTPLRTVQGDVLINRGFVPAERRDPATRRASQITGPVTVTGLLRITEPKGAFLRSNDPGAGRWYSRDVSAIGQARHLDTLAPYFVDADATANPGGYPVSGLTVISFPNSHLIYAITWFSLAGLSIAGIVLLLRQRQTV